MGDYLFSHPDVNDFFTSLRGLPNEEIHGRVQTYMDAHPQTESEINGIRQPLTDLRTAVTSSDHWVHEGDTDMTHRNRSWTVTAASALPSLPSPARSSASSHGVANADVCASGGRRVQVSGCANVADAVAPYVPPPAYYAPMPYDPPPPPNVTGCVSYNGRWVNAAGCN